MTLNFTSMKKALGFIESQVQERHPVQEAAQRWLQMRCKAVRKRGVQTRSKAAGSGLADLGTRLVPGSCASDHSSTSRFQSTGNLSKQPQHNSKYLYTTRFFVVAANS